MRMLCYGDSNTYGYDPRGFYGDRYPKEGRWVDILAQRTGWEIRNEGQNGREIPSRPFQYQRAWELLTQSSPDIFAIMLGTNDLLRGYSAVETCSRMETFLRYLQPGCGQLLLIAPPSMKRGAWITEENLIAESVKLAKSYQALSPKLGIAFADAGQWNVDLAFDGVHFTEEGHRAFAEGLYRHLTK
ncbi:MAG: lipase [Oscillospiraceae bacterium]|nr:lipase [Oscillospiraceae bacterium]